MCNNEWQSLDSNPTTSDSKVYTLATHKEHGFLEPETHIHTLVSLLPQWDLQQIPV